MPLPSASNPTLKETLQLPDTCTNIKQGYICLHQGCLVFSINFVHQLVDLRVHFFDGPSHPPLTEGHGFHSTCYAYIPAGPFHLMKELSLLASMY
jgi:hypothetical protein